MRILIDECLDPGIRDFLAGHQITTVGEAKWQSTADHQLIQLAQDYFDVLLTLDRGFEFQHTSRRLTFGMVVFHPARNGGKDKGRWGEPRSQAVKTVRRGKVLTSTAQQRCVERANGNVMYNPTGCRVG